MNLKSLSGVLTSQVKITDNTSESLVKELISLLAEEFQAWYQYYIVAPFLIGDSRPDVQNFFNEAADDELNDHAAKLLKRIEELQGTVPLSTPESWAEFAKSTFLTAPTEVPSQLSINIQAEQEAIAHYQEVILLAEQENDFVTADILKKIQADEVEHLTKLNDFKQDLV